MNVLGPDIKTSFLPEIPAGMVEVSAASYAKPTVDYLRGPFWDYFQAKLGPLSQWAPRWECWQFVTYYLGLLQEADALAPRFPDGTTALAVGRWDFRPDNPQGSPGDGLHSIVTAFTDQGIIRIDPQNNQLWLPSKNELLSTRRLWF